HDALPISSFTSASNPSSRAARTQARIALLSSTMSMRIESLGAPPFTKPADGHRVYPKRPKESILRPILLQRDGSAELCLKKRIERALNLRPFLFVESDRWSFVRVECLAHKLPGARTQQKGSPPMKP